MCLLYIRTFILYLDIYGAAYLSFLHQCLLPVKLCINARVCHMTSYSVVQLRGLCLPSNTGLYDRARPGAGSLPSLPRRKLHGGSRPASPPAKWANLTIMAVELSVGVGPPQVQYSWGRARTRPQGLVRYRGLLCARVGHGWARLSYTAACLAGNLLTQLWLAQILSGLAKIMVQQCISCVRNKEEILYGFNKIYFTISFKRFQSSCF